MNCVLHMLLYYGMYSTDALDEEKKNINRGLCSFGQLE